MRALFERELERAQSNAGTSDAWARLGALCEANLYWTQAAQCFERASEFEAADPLCALHAAIARTELDSNHYGSAYLLERAAAFRRSAPWKQFAADVLFERGEFEAARGLYEQAAELATERVEPWLGVAECALECERFDEALRALERATQLDPSSKSAHYLSGRAYQALGRADDAKRELAAGAGGRRRRMPDRLSKAAEPLTFDFERVLALAAEWTRDGRPKEAEELLGKHAQRKADDPRLHVNMGIARLRRGSPRSALESFDAALRLDPRAYLAHLNRSACLLELGRAEEALEAARVSMDCAPAAHRPHLAMARASAALERHAEAAQAAARAVDLEPRDPAARQALGEALLIVGVEDDRALEQFRAQCELLPHSWKPLAELARALAIAGRRDEARTTLGAARRLDPDEAILSRLAAQFGLE